MFQNEALQTQLHDERLFTPSTPEELVLVRTQMERLLHSPHFRNSKRYPVLLQFLVEETLAGRGQALKERTVGIEVFGRSADYDTASDPIVRVTVAEVRKRIAQYYHEDAHLSELRIELTPGRYMPEFLRGRDSDDLPQSQHALLASQSLQPAQDATMPAQVDLPANAAAMPSAVDQVSPAPAPAPVDAVPVKLRRKRVWPLWLAVSAALLAVVVFFSLRGMRPSPLEELWGPVLAKAGPMTYCLPLSTRKNGLGRADTTDEAIAHALDLRDAKLPASGTFLDHELLRENVVYSDVLAMMRLESVLELKRRPERVRTNLSATLNDLRDGPVILIGGLSNQWTLQAIAGARYRFAGDDAVGFYVRDDRNPNDREWSLNLQQNWAAVTRDYAIVARVHSPSIGSAVMVAAGIGMSGTAAAGEFLADPAQAAELRRRLGPAMRDHDFEVVIRTDVVDGIAGSPQIVAATLL